MAGEDGLDELVRISWVYNWVGHNLQNPALRQIAESIPELHPHLATHLIEHEWPAHDEWDPPVDPDAIWRLLRVDHVAQRPGYPMRAIHFALLIRRVQAGRARSDLDDEVSAISTVLRGLDADGSVDRASKWASASRDRPILIRHPMEGIAPGASFDVQVLKVLLRERRDSLLQARRSYDELVDDLDVRTVRPDGTPVLSGRGGPRLLPRIAAGIYWHLRLRVPGQDTRVDLCRTGLEQRLNQDHEAFDAHRKTCWKCIAAELPERRPLRNVRAAAQVSTLFRWLVPGELYSPLGARQIYDAFHARFSSHPREFPPA